MKKYTESDIESELKYFTDLISFKNQPMVIEQKKKQEIQRKMFWILHFNKIFESKKGMKMKNYKKIPLFAFIFELIKEIKTRLQYNCHNHAQIHSCISEHTGNCHEFYYNCIKSECDEKIYWAQKYKRNK